jgi:hypothetical protein
MWCARAWCVCVGGGKRRGRGVVPLPGLWWQSRSHVRRVRCRVHWGGVRWGGVRVQVRGDAPEEDDVLEGARTEEDPPLRAALDAAAADLRARGFDMALLTSNLCVLRGIDGMVVVEPVGKCAGCAAKGWFPVCVVL